MINKSMCVFAVLGPVVCLSVAQGAFAEENDADANQKLPRVLLIGDSICGGYQKGVKQRLADHAVVVKQPGSAQHTGTGLEKIDDWLGDGDWDVIHFNWGLWDLAYRNPNSKNFGHLDKIDAPSGGQFGTGTRRYSQADEQITATIIQRLRRVK